LRLLYFKYSNLSHEHPLNGFEHDFRAFELLEDELNPLCLVGVNGSGKSKLLECLAHAFGYLFNIYSSLYARGPYTAEEVEFSIRYAVRRKGKWTCVEVEQSRKYKAPRFRQGTDPSNLKELTGSPMELLPKAVIGYTSGENESLSDWFSRYRDQYAEYYMAAAFGRTTKIVLPTFPNMVWVDYSMNKLVFIANSILSKNDKWGKIEDEVNIQGLRSFRITIRLRPKDGPTKGILLAKEQRKIIDSIQSCATTSYENEKEKLLILDFYVNDVTRTAFKDKFNTAYNLYTSLLQLDLLNHVVLRSQLDEMRRFERDLNERIDRPDVLSTRKAFNISQVKVFVKGSFEVVDYGDLSDGEHQLMQVFGTLTMVEAENTIFLMDEPETHFNPQWRAAFISLMTKIVGKRDQEYLITTHSPFLLSDSKSRNILIFEREKNRLTVKKPESETYGAAVDRLLKIAFKIAPPISLKSRKEVDRLIANETVTIEELENKIDNYGDSIQKLSLYQKIEELRPKTKKSRKK
jgi:restriction system-associated AAA family ATPase